MDTKKAHDGPLVIAIDSSTTSTKAIIVDQNFLLKTEKEFQLLGLPINEKVLLPSIKTGFPYAMGFSGWMVVQQSKSEPMALSIYTIFLENLLALLPEYIKLPG